jgi:hypothetical protein
VATGVALEDLIATFGGIAQGRAQEVRYRHMANPRAGGKGPSASS